MQLTLSFKRLCVYVRENERESKVMGQNVDLVNLDKGYIGSLQAIFETFL